MRGHISTHTHAHEFLEFKKTKHFQTETYMCIFMTDLSIMYIFMYNGR